MEELKQENQQLKARIADLEAQLEPFLRAKERRAQAIRARMAREGKEAVRARAEKAWIASAKARAERKK